MKDIKGFEGRYAVTSCGKVWSYKRKKWLRPSTDERGYQRVSLQVNNEKHTKKLHRLVAEAFIPNPNNLPQVNHKDENPSNNHMSNLEWCDAKYNCNYGHHNENVSKTTGKSVYCVELDIIYCSTREAERKTGVPHENIAACCRGDRYKTAGGYHWKYSD